MDLKLKITQKEGTSMSGLIKQMSGLKCRIKVDIDEGECSIVGIEDNSVENVIDSIDEAFNIVGVDIVPTVEVPEPEVPVVTEDSLEIAKIEFSNKSVENRVNKLMRIIYWAMYYNNASSRDICQYLMSTGVEIAMKYNTHEIVNFSIGDIVNCNFGNHLNGEISGGHVHAIVCDIDDEEGTFYAAPITKEKLEENPQKYLKFKANLDVDYTVSKYNGGTVLLKKGGYIRPERIQEVVGTVRPEFFARLLEALPDTIRFSHNDYAEKYSEKYGDVENDDSMLFDDTDDAIGEETSDVVANETANEENSGEGNTSKDVKKISVEDYVAELLAVPLANLDKSKPIMEQVDMFLDCIGFQTTEKIIKQSFVVACEDEKVTYKSIILELRNVYPEISEKSIKETMREEFKKWLTLYPEAKEKYPKISFMVLLKVFARKMS